MRTSSVTFERVVGRSRYVNFCIELGSVTEVDNKDRATTRLAAICSGCSFAALDGTKDFNAFSAKQFVDHLDLHVAANHATGLELVNIDSIKAKVQRHLVVVLPS